VAEKTISFTAQVIRGSGKGSAMGIPTLNLDLDDVPEELQEGIYAARVTVNGERVSAAMHYGPRPVHGLSRSCEVHLCGAAFRASRTGQRAAPPTSITVEIIDRLRDVKDFDSEEELKEQIAKDIERCKSILAW
jgi:riboflavin kinase / FMN adenylyltransferase